jgi:pimeloyl-ACP methyl ester carboxylesterase
MAAYGDPPVSARFKGLVETAIRRRIERHRHPAAVADAIRAVSRSVAFDGPQALREVAPPVLIVASHDDLDPEHPYEIAERYARLIPRADLISEEAGSSPMAWRGAALSRAILAFLESVGLAPAR